MAKKNYYAVPRGRVPGIYQTWSETEQQVKGFAGASYKGFSTKAEAEAWYNEGVSPPERSLEDATAVSTSTTSLPQPVKRSAEGDNVDPAVKAAANGCMTAYADGACRSNGQVAAEAGIGVHWVQPSHAVDVSERLPGKQTNQCAELYAIVRVLQTDPDPSKALMIFSDSEYAVKSLTEWINDWLKRDWRNKAGKPIENKELIQLAYRLMKRRPGQVTLRHVPGHSGIVGNERADQLAVDGSHKGSVEAVNWLAELRKLDDV